MVDPDQSPENPQAPQGSGGAGAHPAWRRVLLARHAKRPHSLDYIERLVTDFQEIHGDRLFGDDPAIVSGLGEFEGQPVMVVSNVPVGLGVFAGLSSAVGNLLTELFESALQILPGPGQLPPDLTYQQHGVLFGDSLIKRQREVVFSDAGYRTDMINFLANCTQFVPERRHAESD